MAPIVRSILGNRLAHPGRILLEEFMEPFEISQNALARQMGVPPRRINEIVLGRRSITADTALGLEEALGANARFWMALQADYELEIARAKRAARPARAVRAMRPLGPSVELESAADPDRIRKWLAGGGRDEGRR